MPNSLKKLDELSQSRSAVEATIRDVEKRVSELVAAGDNLGAEKLLNESQPLVQLFDEANASIQIETSALRSKVADGTILTDDLDQIGATLPTTSDQIESKYQKATSYMLGGEVDLSSGLGARVRKNLAFILPENKTQYLVEKEGFAPENVVTEKVGGSPVTFVRDDQGKWTPIDEFGVTGKDFIDAVGEIVPTVGSLLTGAGGGALTRTPAGTAITSAAGYTFFGAAQDQIARNILGVGDNFINSIPRRATQAAAGIPIEYATMKLGGPIMRGVATARKGEMTKRAKMFEEAEADLAAAGYQTSLARIASGSVQRQERLLKAGQNLNSWKIGRDLISGAQRLQRVMDDTIGPNELPQSLYEDTIKLFRIDRDNLVRQVAISDENIAKQLRSSVDKDVYRLTSGTQPLNSVQFGDYVNESVNFAKRNAEEAKNQFFNPFYAKNNSLVNVDSLEFADHLAKTFNERVGRPPEVRKIIEDLRQRPRNLKELQRIEGYLAKNPNLPETTAYNLQNRANDLRSISGNINASQLDDYYRTIRQLAPSGPIAGSGAGTLKEISASVSKAAKLFRDDVYRQAGIYDEWLAATNSHDNFMAYTANTNTLPSILETIGGTQKRKMSGQEISSLIFRSPENLNEVLTAVSKDDPTNFGRFTMRLQQEYLNKIGLNGNKIGGLNKFEFNDEIVQTLFGGGNELRGNMMITKLRGLQDLIKTRNLDPSKITYDDIRGLQGTLSESSVKEMQNTIASRIAKQDELDKQVSSILLKDAMNGHIESLSQGVFPKAIFEADPSIVKKALSKFGPQDQSNLRKDYAEYLFSLYRGEPDATIGRYMLWNGQKLLDDIRLKPRIRQNMEAVLGEDQTKTILAASRQMEAVRTRPFRDGVEITGVVTQDPKKGVAARLFAPVQSVLSAIGDRTAGAMYRSGDLMPFLRKIGQKELTPEQYDAEISKAAMLLFTSNGMQAYLETGKYDPEWSYRLGRSVGALGKESLQFKEKYGFENKPQLGK
jgi:hypothetical protein